MKRFNELQKILNQGRYFKIVCGAGNEDAQEVYKLSLVYTLAGATGIDVSANVEVVKSAKNGVDKAFALAGKLSRTIEQRPFINVSIGMRGDPHIRKALIDNSRCTLCGRCVDSCPQKAITEELTVTERRCIGCGICAGVCQETAVSFFDKRRQLREILPECLRCGAETFELHAIIPDEESVRKDWLLMNEILTDNYISMCLDRSQLSDAAVAERLKAAHKITGERMIVQADGVPMSGSADDYNTTLQAVAIADIVNKTELPIMVLASGGTNSRTGDLANLCGVKINGVAVGTFARKIVAQIIEDENFGQNLESINKAVSVASKLVSDNISRVCDGKY